MHPTYNSGNSPQGLHPQMMPRMGKYNQTQTSNSMGHTAYFGGSGGHTVQSERVLSSNIVGETFLGPMPPEENIQYVEVS